VTESVLNAQRAHLSSLLEAIQRCVYFLHASDQKLIWPLTAKLLEEQKKNVELFESLAAVNERFAKLQDTLGAAMRHATLLAGEPNDTFLKVLSFFEKAGVLESVQSWQLLRTMRNLAAHDYETEYAEIADHFNSLHELLPILYRTAFRFLDYCRGELFILPTSGDFAEDFMAISGSD
jgi:hypothetical protein